MCKSVNRIRNNLLRFIYFIYFQLHDTTNFIKLPKSTDSSVLKVTRRMQARLARIRQRDRSTHLLRVYSRHSFHKWRYKIFGVTSCLLRFQKQKFLVLTNTAQSLRRPLHIKWLSANRATAMNTKEIRNQQKIVSKILVMSRLALF